MGRTAYSKHYQSVMMLISLVIHWTNTDCLGVEYALKFPNSVPAIGYRLENAALVQPDKKGR
jgi:hypothetical protein